MKKVLLLLTVCGLFLTTFACQQLGVYTISTSYDDSWIFHRYRSENGGWVTVRNKERVKIFTGETEAENALINELYDSAPKEKQEILQNYLASHSQAQAELKILNNTITKLEEGEKNNTLDDKEKAQLAQLRAEGIENTRERLQASVEAYKKIVFTLRRYDGGYIAGVNTDTFDEGALGRGGGILVHEEIRGRYMLSKVTRNVWTGQVTSKLMYKRGRASYEMKLNYETNELYKAKTFHYSKYNTSLLLYVSWLDTSGKAVTRTWMDANGQAYLTKTFFGDKGWQTTSKNTYIGEELFCTDNMYAGTDQINTRTLFDASGRVVLIQRQNAWVNYKDGETYQMKMDDEPKDDSKAGYHITVVSGEEETRIYLGELDYGEDYTFGTDNEFFTTRTYTYSTADPSRLLEVGLYDIDGNNSGRELFDILGRQTCTQQYNGLQDNGDDKVVSTTYSHYAGMTNDLVYTSTYNHTDTLTGISTYDGYGRMVDTWNFVDGNTLMSKTTYTYHDYNNMVMSGSQTKLLII